MIRVLYLGMATAHAESIATNTEEASSNHHSQHTGHRDWRETVLFYV